MKAFVAGGQSFSETLSGITKVVTGNLNMGMLGLVAILATLVLTGIQFAQQLDEIGNKFGAIGVKEFGNDLIAADAQMARLGFSTGDAAIAAEELANEFGVGF